MKMKNLFLSMLAVAGMLMATSCSKEDAVSESSDFVNATFSITTADAIGTRATIGTGSKVDVVACAVYDANGVELKDLYAPEIPVTDGTATYNVRLAKGQNYRIAFFAYNKAADAYNVADLNNIVVKDDQFSNKEDRDAFTNYLDVEGSQSAINLPVTLYRPFAQLNLGIDDTEFNAAKSAGIEVAQSQIVVSNVYTAFSAFNNAVVGETSNMTFKMNAIPTEELEVTVNGTLQYYNYLALNYLLVGDKDSEKTLTDVEFSWVGKDNETNTSEFINIPVQRNYRTNIIGKLLTNPATFNIVINAGFNGEYREDGEKLVHKVFNAKDLQAVLNGNLAAGTHTFYLGAKIEGDVTILQKEGVNIVIDGCGYKWDGTATINGDARAAGAETLTFKNIKFEATAKKTFIDAPSKVNGKYNYSHNVTIDNCEFSSPAYNEEIVGAKFNTTYNAVVKNSSAKNIHTLVQFQSTDNATLIENVTVVNCKNGIALGNIGEAKISGANIVANGYGIRIDGTSTRKVDVDIENSSIKAYIPVTVRDMDNDACNVDVELVGTNNLERTGDYDIAFCSNEYEEGKTPESPMGTFRLQNAEDYVVFYGTTTSSFSALDAAVNSNSGDVVVEEAISNPGTGIEVERDVTLDFQNNEYNAGSTAYSYWYAIEANGDYNVVIKNAYFTRAGVSAANGADVLFESGVINHKPERTSRYIFNAVSGSTITIKDGTFTNDRAKNSYFRADNATIYVKGGNFGGAASNKKVVTSNGGQVIITGGTFNFDPTEWLASGYTATPNGSNWVVSAI